MFLKKLARNFGYLFLAISIPLGLAALSVLVLAAAVHILHYSSVLAVLFVLFVVVLIGTIIEYFLERSDV